MNYVFDACALIAFLNRETGEGFETVNDLLERACEENVSIYMSIVNLIEVYYGYMRDTNKETADQIMDAVQELPIKIIDTISEEAFYETARYKSSYSMSLADAFACAAAKCLSAVLVTKDREMTAAERTEHLPVLWM